MTKIKLFLALLLPLLYGCANKDLDFSHTLIKSACAEEALNKNIECKGISLYIFPPQESDLVIDSMDRHGKIFGVFGKYYDDCAYQGLNEPNCIRNLSAIFDEKAFLNFFKQGFYESFSYWSGGPTVLASSKNSEPSAPENEADKIVISEEYRESSLRNPVVIAIEFEIPTQEFLKRQGIHTDWILALSKIKVSANGPHNEHYGSYSNTAGTAFAVTLPRGASVTTTLNYVLYDYTKNRVITYGTTEPVLDYVNYAGYVPDHFGRTFGEKIAKLK